jgi:hypothetical protein
LERTQRRVITHPHKDFRSLSVVSLVDCTSLVAVLPRGLPPARVKHGQLRPRGYFLNIDYAHGFLSSVSVQPIWLPTEPRRA